MPTRGTTDTMPRNLGGTSHLKSTGTAAVLWMVTLRRVTSPHEVGLKYNAAVSSLASAEELVCSHSLARSTLALTLCHEIAHRRLPDGAGTT